MRKVKWRTNEKEISISTLVYSTSARNEDPSFRVLLTFEFLFAWELNFDFLILWEMVFFMSLTPIATLYIWLIVHFFYHTEVINLSLFVRQYEIKLRSFLLCNMHLTAVAVRHKIIAPANFWLSYAKSNQHLWPLVSSVGPCTCSQSGCTTVMLLQDVLSVG